MKSGNEPAWMKNGWSFLQPWGLGSCFGHKKGLRVIVDSEKKSDGEVWMHVSFSRKDRLPDYQDITFVRDSFIPGSHYCYMIFPPAEHYVNIHKFCLHLWARADGQRIGHPEFSEGSEALLGKKSI